jgi:hypothetical protein
VRRPWDTQTKPCRCESATGLSLEASFITLRESPSSVTVILDPSSITLWSWVPPHWYGSPLSRSYREARPTRGEETANSARARVSAKRDSHLWAKVHFHVDFSGQKNIDIFQVFNYSEPCSSDFLLTTPVGFKQGAPGRGFRSMRVAADRCVRPSASAS